MCRNPFIAVAWSVRTGFGFQLAAFPLTLNPSPTRGEGLGVRVRTRARESVLIRLSNAISTVLINLAIAIHQSYLYNTFHVNRPLAQIPQSSMALLGDY
jgi:hypothetical protein